MTIVNLMLNLKAMLDKNFETLEVKGRNKETEKNLLNIKNINIDMNTYSKPAVFIGYRPVNINDFDFPGVVIIPPVAANENLQTKRYDITFILSIKHNNKIVDGNACLEALSFLERVKDIILKNRLVGGYMLYIDTIEWGIDILANASNISICEIKCFYESNNNN